MMDVGMLNARKTQVGAAQAALVSLILSALIALGFAAPARAQEAAKIGFVSTERILREAAPAKAAQAKLEAEFSKRDREIQELGNRVRQLAERLERDGAVMTEADRTRRQRELAEQDRELQRRQREFREDLNQRRNEELATVVERANKVIKQIAETERFDIIFQDAVFASPRIDITDKVLRQLNGTTAAPSGPSR